MLATRAADAHCALVYVNQVGGQDELVFDGGSLVFDAEGTLLARGPQFVEDLMIVDVPIAPRLPQAAARPSWPAHRGRAAAVARDRRAASAARRPPPAATIAPHARARRPSCTRRSCSAPATTCARTASPTSSSGCRAASTRRSSRASPSTRSAPTTCTACRCRRATRATARSPTPPMLAENLGHRLPHDRRSSRRSAPTSTCSRRSFAGTPARPHRGEPAEPHAAARR